MRIINFMTLWIGKLFGRAPNADASVLRVSKISYTKRGVRRLKLPIVGESHHNEDGIARQFLIKKLKAGNVIYLVREPENPFDQNAIRVDCRHGCIGYISREHAEQIAPVMDGGELLRAEVANIWGGTPGKPHRGVWIWLWGEDADPSRSADATTKPNYTSDN